MGGRNLGFPASISYCLNAFSKENNIVLILDQLDALRWTARNSKSSLATCLELIREIRDLNLERENKISIIFVCRTYDLEMITELRRYLKTNRKMILNLGIKLKLMNYWKMRLRKF